MSHPAKTTESFTIDIPASYLPERFEERRREIYKNTGPEERASMLTSLVEMAPVDDATVYEKVLDEATYPGGNNLIKIENGDYRITLGQDGLITDIQRIIRLVADEKRTQRARAMARRVPWGPKVNASSFRGPNQSSARPRLH